MAQDGRVYRVRQLPLHLAHRDKVPSFLVLVAPVLGAVDNIRVFSLAQEKDNSKTATVKFKTLPPIFDNDRSQWTLEAEDVCGQNVIVDVHFRGFTVLNEARGFPHTADCIAISGLASHPFGSWKYRDPSSDYMWLRDRLPKDVPKLRSLIYGYDTKLFKSRSFQDLDDIARSFIASLKELRRSLSPAKYLFILAHSLGGIVLKRALVLLAYDGSDEETAMLKSVKGLVFFGVPHKGMEISHFLAMVAKQPNEDLISRTLSPSSTLLPELSKEFSEVAFGFNKNIRYAYETLESQLTEQTPTGTWIRSEVSYAVLVNKDSAIPQGTPPRHTIAINEDHSNMVKLAEDDPVYQVIKSYLCDLCADTNDQISGQYNAAYPQASRISRQGAQGSARRSISTIPFSQDANFVGREDILAQLESELADPRPQLWASLCGLGGIGKSQIAIEYSYRQRARFPQISTFWIHVSSKARFEQSYVEIAKEAELPGIGDDKVDILQLVSRYLADEGNGPWLLILDNADDATVLLNQSSSDGESDAVSVQRRLLDLVPRVQHGSVIITTRDRSCALKLIGYRDTPIEVLAMTLDESVELLRLFLPQVHKDEASELVGELENVPLAISQAGAYIKEVPRVSIPKYLAIFRRSREDQVALLNKNKEDLRRDPTVPNAVITSWELSFNKIRQQSPDSADLLSLMSYFNRQAIPRFLLQGDVDELTFEENISLLLNFSLIRAEIREDIFELHRLVQVAMQHWLRSEGHEQLWRERAIGRLANEFPRTDVQREHWPICEVLMSHAEEVICYSASSKESAVEHAYILYRTAWYVTERKGDEALGVQRSNEALQIQQQYFDDDSDQVLNTLGALAVAKRGLGKFQEAVDLQESILKRRLENSADNKVYLVAMHNLACSYVDLGRFEKAEGLMTRVVEAMGSLLRPDHPDSFFLSAESLLVKIYLSLVKYEEAERLGIKTLKISARLYGFEHVITLTLLKDLSRVYLELNQLEKAEDMIAQAIPFFLNLLGPSDRDSIDARILLAQIYRRQCKLDEARDICLSCLEVARELQGSYRGLQLDCANLLGQIHRDRGEFTDALRLLKDTVESSRELWGNDHPNTLFHMRTLATCYHAMGDTDHAVRLMEEVLEKRRRVLPANHPATTRAAELLAYWKGKEEESGRLEIVEEDSEEWETEEEVEEGDGIQEEEEVSEEEESEQDENKDEATENESERYDTVRNQLANFHVSSPANRKAVTR